MRCSKRSPGVDGWPPDSSDLTLDHATESIPVKFNFIACTVGHSEEPVVDERVVVSRNQRCKIVSIIEDFVYGEAKRKKQTQIAGSRHDCASNIRIDKTFKHVTWTRTLGFIVHRLQT